MNADQCAAPIKGSASILMAFSRALGREAHVIKDSPHLLWQQLFNRLQWEWDTVKHVLLPVLTRRVLNEPKPWLRLKSPYRESQALLRTLEGHTNKIAACAFSPDGRFVLSGSYDDTLRLWDPVTGMLLHTIHTPSMILDCAFSPDGRWILSAGGDTLRIWDSSTGELRHTFQGTIGPIRSCSFSPDGAFVVSSGGSLGNWVFLWHIATGRYYNFKGHSDHVQTCVFSPDGRLIGSGSSDKTLQIWDASPGEMLPGLSDQTIRTWVEDIFAWEYHVRALAGHTREVTACVFSPDGQTILSGDWGNALRLWDVTTGETIRTLEGHTGPIAACAFSPDGCRIVSGSYDTTLRLWDTQTGEILGIFAGHPGPVRGCGFSPDGLLLVSASEDQTLRLWDISLGAGVEALQGHKDEVRNCSYSQDGQIVVSSSKDETIRIWDGTSGRELHILKGHQGAVNQCVISAEGHSIVSSGVDGAVRIWSFETGELRHTLDCSVEGMMPGEQTIFAVSPDGEQIGSATRNAVKIWDSRSGQCLRTLEGHTDEVYDLEFSPDGQWLASASRDKTARVWDASNGEQVHTLQSPGFMRASTFSPDGRWIATGGGNMEGMTLSIWDTTTGELIQSLDGHTQQVRACSFSPDGAHLVSFALDGTMRIWDPARGICLQILDDLPGFVKACVFSPDGNMLVAAMGKTLQIWDAGNYTLHACLPNPGNISAVSLHPFEPEFLAGDSGGSLYRATLVGVHYGPIVVTAADRGRRFEIRCPACQRSHEIFPRHLGTIFTCPNLACGLDLRINPLPIGRYRGL